MVCNGCSTKLRSALSQLDNLTVQAVDPRSGLVELAKPPEVSSEQIQQVITKAGFKIVPKQ